MPHAVDNATPNNTIEYRQKLSEILAISQTMLDYAKRNEWSELTLIETHRRKLLEDFFSQTITPEIASMIEEVIRQIMEIDKDVIALGEEMQKQMGKDLQRIAKGKVATKAYTENSR